jgi:hypothetical protein
MCKFQLVWFDAYEDYNCFGEVSFFIVSKASKWNKEQRLSLIEMLWTAYGEECLSRTNVFVWHKSFKSSSESENAKISGENNVDCIFMPEKQTVNGKFYKQLFKRLFARVHRVGPEFKKSGSWYLLHCTALHCTGAFFGRCLRAFGETRDPRVIPSTLPPWFSTGWLSFLFPKL